MCRAHWLFGASLLVASLPGVVGSPTARAHFDPTVAHHLSAAAPPAPLPRQPRVAWRTHLGSELCPGLAATSEGGVLAATRDARLLELDPRGHVIWQQPLSSAAQFEPLLLSNGDRVAITEQSSFCSYSPGGTPRAERRLPLTFTGRRAVALPLADGSLVLASGSRVLWLENDGTVRSTTAMNADVDALLPIADAVLVATSSGELSLWEGYKRAQRLTASSTTPARIARWSEPRSWLQTTQQTVSVVRLEQHVEVRWELGAGQGEFWGSAQLLPKGRAVARALPDLLLLLGNDGTERRVLLSKTVPSAGAEPPPLVAGKDGRVVAFGNDGRVAFVDETGTSQFVAEVECVTPAALVSTTSGAVVASCKNGTLFGIEERTD